MPWFDHPAYRPIRDELINRFRSRRVDFRRLKHVIFLCGGIESKPRDALLGYLRRWASDALVFQADDVWDRIASTKQNALEMEAKLAELSDAVIVIAESPGTFAELGAFSNNDELRRKLLPILDIQYRDAPSFINTGPVRWTNDDSLFNPTLFVKLDSILSAADQILSRLERLTPASAQPIDNLAEHPKHLLFFIRDILAVIGPVTAIHIERYITEILGAVPPDIVSLLGLAESLDLVKAYDVELQKYFFVRMTDDFRPVVKKRFFELPNERAKVLSVLQTIEQARKALRLSSKCV